MSNPRALRAMNPEISLGPMGSLPPEPQTGLQKIQSLIAKTALIWICLVYLSVSGSLILVNKYIMVDDGFHYPFTVSLLGMVFSSILSTTVCKVYNINTAKDQIDTRLYITKILPVGFCMALTLYLGNLVYFHLNVAFIQILKATTPIMVMIALFVSNLEKPTVPLVVTVSVIAVGTVIASYGEVNFSLVGVLIMFSAELLEATKLVLMQKLLVGLEFHPIEGLMYLAPACCFWLGLEVLFVEAGQMYSQGALLLVARKPLIYACAFLMGFFVNLTAYMVIQHSSALMLKNLGHVRSAVLVAIATFFMGEHVTWLQIVGYTISLLGFYLYNKVRSAQAHAQFLQQQQAASKVRPGSIINVK